MNKIKYYITHPIEILTYLINTFKIKINDETYIKLIYRSRMGFKLNLNNPTTLNEKIQWLKLNDRNPQYIKMVDKFLAKEFIKEKIGEDYIIPTLGIWNNYDEINFDKLPNQFVLKCTHDSGGLTICRDKNEFNYNKAKRKINKSLKRNYYYWGREWPYKNVKPRIIAEKYMENLDGTYISDYKFYCFLGKCEYVMICNGRQEGKTKFYYYNRNWQLMRNMSNDGKEAPPDFMIEKPEGLEEMFKIAEKLSTDFKFVRVDLYNINKKIYFGEFTFYPSSGFDDERTKECDEILSKCLNLN